jgi:putative addiction module component (TIGR02574 family)
MKPASIAIDDLSTEDRIELIGRLWDSLDPAVAAPITPELAAEIDRREAEADRDKSGGIPWHEITAELERKLHG